MPSICTIITEDWVDRHLIRWLRYVNMNLQGWDKYLYYLGGNMDKMFPTLRTEFTRVVTLPPTGRPQFNRVRMSATTDFGVDEIMYLDADADVIAPINLEEVLSGRSTLACVESPATHQDWTRIAASQGWGSEEYNNGLLWMSEDWGERYDKAVEEVKGLGAHPRIEGTIAFNWMLHKNEGWEALPYSHGVIWWDTQSFLGAKVIQYCNDRGQAKRVQMENEWRASRLPRPEGKND